MSQDPKPRHYKGAGLVAFRARQGEIGKLLAAGFPQREIYRQLGEALGISYSQFNRYVQKHLMPSEAPRHDENALGRARRAVGNEPDSQSPSQQKPRPAGKPSGTRGKKFDFDPEARNTRDNLI